MFSVTTVSTSLTPGLFCYKGLVRIKLPPLALHTVRWLHLSLQGRQSDSLKVSWQGVCIRCTDSVGVWVTTSSLILVWDLRFSWRWDVKLCSLLYESQRSGGAHCLRLAGFGCLKTVAVGSSVTVISVGVIWGCKMMGKFSHPNSFSTEEFSFDYWVEEGQIKNRNILETIIWVV
jgi:hypothetical protein